MSENKKNNPIPKFDSDESMSSEILHSEINSFNRTTFNVMTDKEKLINIDLMTNKNSGSNTKGDD